MAQNSTIEWTDATWNPVTGCTKVGAGCDNCYAGVIAERFRGTAAFPNGFDVMLRPHKLDAPLKWKKPRRIFVNSMSDLFHKDVPEDYIDKVYDVMEQADWHTYQVLTKRSSMMQLYLIGRMNGKPRPKHIWHGVSVENQQTLGRIEHVRDAKTYNAFVSFEPLLGSVAGVDLSRINWAIVGGESGHGARPMNPEWVAEIHRACQKSGTAFFFKQWGAFGADGIKRSKKANGRKWQGKTWDEMPIYS